MKWSAIGGAISGGVSVVLSLAISLSIAVDGFIPSQVALTIFSTLIDVNAVLIGFWGLILIYGLGHFRSTKNELVRLAHELKIEVSKLEIRKGTEKGARELCERMEQAHLDSIKVMIGTIKGIDESVRAFSVWGFVVAMVYVASIILSVLSLGKIGVNGIEDEYLVYSLVTFFAAIAFTWIGIWATTPEKTSME